MKNKRYFPMFIDLSDKKIVVVGGGNIATRRIRTLLQFTRNITAIAPKSDPQGFIPQPIPSLKPVRPSTSAQAKCIGLATASLPKKTVIGIEIP